MSDMVIPDPKSRIVSPDEAARIADRNAKYDRNGRRIRPPGDIMEDPLTRKDAMTHLAIAVNAAVVRAMEEQDDALGERLEEMEKIITQNVLLALERTTWHYRFRRWLRGTRAGEYLIELGVMDPPMVVMRHAPGAGKTQGARDSAVEVTPNIDDPNALTWRSAPEGFTGELAEWLSQGNRVAVARHPRTHDWFLMAHDTPTLERAARMIGGENPTFEDGVTSAQLNDEFTERAFAIIANGGEVPRGGWDG